MAINESGSAGVPHSEFGRINDVADRFAALTPLDDYHGRGLFTGLAEVFMAGATFEDVAGAICNLPAGKHSLWCEAIRGELPGAVGKLELYPQYAEVFSPNSPTKADYMTFSWWGREYIILPWRSDSPKGWFYEVSQEDNDSPVQIRFRAYDYGREVAEGPLIEFVFLGVADGVPNTVQLVSKREVPGGKRYPTTEEARAEVAAEMANVKPVTISHD